MLIETLKEIQKLLKQAGLYTGKIDGVIGNGSYSAVLGLSGNKKAKQIIKEIQKILAENRVYFGLIDGDFGQGSMTGFNDLLPAPQLTDAKLQAIYKNCKPGFAAEINKQIEKYHIKTKGALCAFLANAIHETGGFLELRESMAYNPQRLLQVFPKYFKSLAAAQAIAARGQVAIADVVYGGRMGNGVGNGDGYKYRGGGIMHTTGSQMYELTSIGIGAGKKLHENPDLITQPYYAVASGLWYWNKNLCNRYANQGNFLATCKIVNLGDAKSKVTPNGQVERNALHARAWNVL